MELEQADRLQHTQLQIGQVICVDGASPQVATNLGLGLRVGVSGFGFRVWGFEFRVYGFTVLQSSQLRS
jgi:hypothetical protein